MRGLPGMTASGDRVAVELCGLVTAHGLNFPHHPPQARIMRARDATIYPPLAGGCHCARDTSTAIRQAGFEVTREERLAFKPSSITPAIPHILGAATIPVNTPRSAGAR